MPSLCSPGRCPSRLKVLPSPKLAPAQKALPCDARTTARQPSSSSSASSAPAISLMSEMSKKLFGGRRISTRATKSAVSTPISLNGLMCVIPCMSRVVGQDLTQAETPRDDPSQHLGGAALDRELGRHG